MIPLSAISVEDFPEPDALCVTTSQCGEDAIVHHFFTSTIIPPDGKGFYIDVGAHHPRFYSNTALLYALGWRGINIDANPALLPAFEQARPRDININKGVAREPGRLPFYTFPHPGTNTFSADFRDALVSSGYKHTGTVELDVAPLRNILAPHLSPGDHVHYLNIDIEGLDDVAIETYDFDNYPPDLISIEVHGLDLENPLASTTVTSLKKRGYKLMSHAIGTAFFRRA